jgi:hypothetical protein
MADCVIQRLLYDFLANEAVFFIQALCFLNFWSMQIIDPELLIFDFEGCGC